MNEVQGRKLTWPIFLEIVEIRTKIASIFPFLLGVLFSLSYFQQIQLGYTCLFFIGMLIFDMTTTAINNYMDYQKAKSDVYKYTENVIGREQLAPQTIRRLIYGMLAIAAIIGFTLSFLTGWLLLVMGGLACLVGIFYTFGPIPLSRMPLGELFSGVTMGLGIFVMTVYINTVNHPPFFLAVDFTMGTFRLTGNLWQSLAIVLAAVPLVLTIANIMLANNLRDLEVDIQNHRYTLVYYIGREQGIFLFQLAMLAAYVVLLIGWPFHVFHWQQLVVFGTFPFIRKNLRAFKQTLPHPKSFGYAIKNMIIFNSAYAATFLLTLLMKK